MSVRRAHKAVRNTWCVASSEDSIHTHTIDRHVQSLTDKDGEWSPDLPRAKTDHEVLFLKLVLDLDLTG